MAQYTDFYTGKALHEYPDDYTVIDVETTGLSPLRDSIIEISAVKYRCNSKVDEFVTLVAFEGRLPGIITRITGITIDMLIGAPNVVDAMQDFLAFIGDDILLGYNVRFDLAFLGAACAEYCSRPLSNNYVDVLRIANNKLPFLASHRQVVVAKYFGIRTDGSHRALADCEICNACYQKLKDDEW